MTEITTEKGLKLMIDEKAFDDMRFLDNLNSFESGNLFALAKITNQILGEENKEAFYKSLENEEGRIPIEEASTALTEIMTKVKTAKNS